MSRRELRNPCRQCKKAERISHENPICWDCLDLNVKKTSASYVNVDKTPAELVPDSMKKYKGKGLLIRKNWGSTYTGSD